MKARDVMQTKVITARPESSVREIAKLLLENRISAVPVVDQRSGLVGIVSEGDLMRGPDSGTGRHASWWLSLAATPEDKALAVSFQSVVHSVRAGEAEVARLQ